MTRFHDWKVVVTGGTRGIGRGIVEAFLQQGAYVMATYTKNDQEANLLKEELSQFGDKLFLEKFDISNSEEVKQFYSRLEERWDRLDVLVNNAGIKSDQITALMKDEEWKRVLSINLDGTFFMSRSAIPLMMKNRFGRIIHISSISGKMGLSGQVNYSATKAAQVAMSQVMAKEVGKKGITVNAVCPGFIETDMIASMTDEHKREIISEIPVRRLGLASDVAHVVTFLATRESSYITGTSIDVSGGLGS
ncbi:MAG: beta-ketoacyl-ACP reductase [Bdellovibrionales bacterium GWA2_49_15]|nr:MAG: beta-ketoacyl-ACP reductase [Bdellovibrionales bacterium GWA2_49_15]